MHYFISEMAKMNLGSTRGFAQNAQSIYDESLDAYMRIIFRRPLAKLIVSTSVSAHFICSQHF